MKRRSVVVSALVIPTSGCTSLFGGGDDDSPPAVDDQEQREDDPEEPVSTINADDIDTASVLPSITDLPDAYEQGSDTEQHRSELEGDLQTEFDRQDLELRHERSFIYEGEPDGEPAILSAAVLIYETQSAAEGGIDEIADDEEFDLSSEQTEIASGFEVREVIFENDRGEQVTLLLYQDRNIVLYTTALSGSGSPIQQDLLIDMITAVETTQ